eukprot:sb/3461639/
MGSAESRLGVHAVNRQTLNPYDDKNWVEMQGAVCRRLRDSLSNSMGTGFSGSFENMRDPPELLVRFLEQLLFGRQSSSATSSATTIAGLIEYHFVDRDQSGDRTVVRRHNKGRETCQLLLSSLSIYCFTQSRKVIDSLHSSGKSVSWDRLRQIVVSLSNQVDATFTLHKQLLPIGASFGPGVIIGAKDNINQNKRVTFSSNHLNGTAMFILECDDPGWQALQQAPYEESRGVKRNFVSPEESPVVVDKDQLKMCHIKGTRNMRTLKAALTAAIANEICWQSQSTEDWVRYHSARQSSRAKLYKVKAFPVVPQHINRHSTTKWCMDINAGATSLMTPQQDLIVDVGDAPVYARTWEVKLTYPDKYKMYLPIIGLMHWEKVIQSCYSKLTAGTGLVEQLNSLALSIDGAGTALETCHHLTRGAYIIQLVTATLRQHKMDSGQDHVYWDVVVDLGTLYSVFLRSVRAGDFDLNLAAQREILPFFFSLNNLTYARWGSVNLETLLCLQDTSPALYDCFRNGGFVGRLTDREFSGMAHDQLYEQCICRLKNVNGNPGDLSSDIMHRALPVLEQLLNLPTASGTTLLKHHSIGNAHQQRYQKDMKLLLDHLPNVFKDRRLLRMNDGVPFDDDKGSIAKQMATFRADSETRYTTFVSQRIWTNDVPWTKSLKEAPLKLPGLHEKKGKSRKKLIQEFALLSKLKLAKKYRPDETLEAMGCELGEIPFCFQDNTGDVGFGTKSQLLRPLRDMGNTAAVTNNPYIATIVDLSMVTRAISLPPLATFKEWFEAVLRQIFTIGKNSKRIDIVTDRYDVKNPLKSATAERRATGKGAMVSRVDPSDRVPGNRSAFMAVEENKNLLYNAMIHHFKDKCRHLKNQVIVIGYKEEAWTNDLFLDISSLQGCQHPEADTRLLLHCNHARTGAKGGLLKIRCDDTDVLVLSVALTFDWPVDVMLEMGKFGSTNVTSTKEIQKVLGKDGSVGLLFLHAFSGN